MLKISYNSQPLHITLDTNSNYLFVSTSSYGENIKAEQVHIYTILCIPVSLSVEV